MANTIQIKRSASAATPSSLAAGELAFSENSSKLFIGTSSSTVLPVGGTGAFLRSDTNDTFDGNLVVTGNLTVNGATTTIASNTISVGDNIIELNNDLGGGASPTQDAGITVNRGNQNAAFWQWNETNDYWEPKVGSSAADIKGVNDLVVGGNGSITGDLAVDGVANLDNTDIDGTLVVDGTNISLDSTTTLNIDNSNTSNGVTINTATSGSPVTIGHSTSVVTIGDNLAVTGDATIGLNLLPDANDGATIGANGTRFSNIYGVLGNINTLTVNTAAVLASASVSDLTSGRVVYAGSSGELQDNSGLTYDGSTLTAPALTLTGAFTSLGIDDNATGERLQIANTSIKIMSSGVTLEGFSSGAKSVLDNFVIDGGSF